MNFPMGSNAELRMKHVPFIRPSISANFAQACGLCGLLAVSGCIILPIPNARVEGSGVRSQILDADTGKPIPGAKVSDRVNGGDATTDAEGRFCLQPHVQWHAGYLSGVLDYPIWPFTGDVIMPERSIRIAAPGYGTTDVDIELFGRHSAVGVMRDGDYLIVERIPVRIQAPPRK